jgi:hypothetical protein
MMCSKMMCSLEQREQWGNANGSTLRSKPKQVDRVKNSCGLVMSGIRVPSVPYNAFILCVGFGSATI